MNKISLIDKAFLLKQTTPFRQLTLDLLLPIADKLAIASFDKNDEIFNWEEEAHRMYFVVEGSVELVTPRQERVVVEAGSFFGDEALFNDRGRSYRSRCLSTTTLLTLSQTNLLTILSECPAVALGFLTVYATENPCRPFLNRSENL